MPNQFRGSAYASGNTLSTYSGKTRLQVDPFDILITAHEMPVLAGLALVTRLRQTPFSSGMIMFSGGLSTKDHAAVLEGV